jgi:LPXTG-motif cell wall-anchored protein
MDNLILALCVYASILRAALEPSAAPALFSPGTEPEEGGGVGEPAVDSSSRSRGGKFGATTYILIAAGGLVLIGSALYVRRRKEEEEDDMGTSEPSSVAQGGAAAAMSAPPSDAV